MGELTSYGYSNEAMPLTERTLPANRRAGKPLRIEARRDLAAGNEVSTPVARAYGCCVPCSS